MLPDGSTDSSLKTVELWLARDLQNTDGSQIFKTFNGAQLTALNTRVEVMWDNNNVKIAEMPSPDIIVVWHDDTPYQFARSSPHGQLS